MGAAVNIQCVPTPLIAAKRGAAAQAQGYPVVQTAIEDETFTPIQDEASQTIVNEQ
jgi:hypothetical protein